MKSYILSVVNRLVDIRRELTGEYKPVPVKRIEEVTECYHEVAIYSGYRTNYSPKQAFCSFFQHTNETVNFWTHFIPSLFFLYEFYSLSKIYDFNNDPYVYPLFWYMTSIVLYPLVSALAHGFSCMSPLTNHICFLLDYSTLSLYSWSAGLLYCAYCLPYSFYNTWYSTFFLPIGSLLAILATFCACFSRLTNTHILRKVLRLCAFTIPFIWDSIPLLIRLFSCDPDLDTCYESSPYHFTQFMSVSAASFFYGTHIPEIFVPGRFDFIGHSHNLLHVFGTFATYQQMKASLIDMTGRRNELQNMNWIIDPVWCDTITPLIIIFNFVVISAFAVVLSKIPGKLEPFCCHDSTFKPAANITKDDNEKKTQ